MSDFGLELILAEEIQGRGMGGGRLADQSIVIERRNFTASAPFVVGDDARSFPIFGVGTVESLLLITEGTDYSITVDLDTPSDMVGADESAFIDGESYTDLKAMSTELESVAAYESAGGNYVLDIGPVSFIDNVRAFVEPGSGLSVLRQRGEITVERRVE